MYELTDRGREEGLAWLADMVGKPRKEVPEFPAALSFIMLLDADTMIAALEQRAAAIQQDLAKFDGELQTYGDTVPRIALLETEYQRAITGAEVAWLNGVIDDLRSGKLTVWAPELRGVGEVVRNRLIWVIGRVLIYGEN